MSINEQQRKWEGFTVAELISALNDQPRDAVVFLEYPMDISLSMASDAAWSVYEHLGRVYVSSGPAPDDVLTVNEEVAQ